IEEREGTITWSDVPALASVESAATPITWTTEPGDPKTGHYLVNTPAVRVAAGNIGGERIQLGDCRIEVTNGPKHYAVVSVVSLDGQPIANAKRILVTVAGRAENTGMMWDKKRQSVRENIGEAPTLAEAITATITVPGTADVAALDEIGNRKATVPVKQTEGGIAFEVGRDHETLWYSIERP
ncbi:MAG: hypothetical protein WA771_02795, partial [Chthoniobacterales bacterium]